MKKFFILLIAIISFTHTGKNNKDLSPQDEDSYWHNTLKEGKEVLSTTPKNKASIAIKAISRTRACSLGLDISNLQEDATYPLFFVQDTTGIYVFATAFEQIKKKSLFNTLKSHKLTRFYPQNFQQDTDYYEQLGKPKIAYAISIEKNIDDYPYFIFTNLLALQKNTANQPTPHQSNIAIVAARYKQYCQAWGLPICMPLRPWTEE